jgi:hypothetical protein
MLGRLSGDLGESSSGSDDPSRRQRPKPRDLCASEQGARLASAAPDTTAEAPARILFVDFVRFGQTLGAPDVTAVTANTSALCRAAIP